MALCGSLCSCLEELAGLCKYSAASGLRLSIRCSTLQQVRLSVSSMAIGKECIYRAAHLRSSDRSFMKAPNVACLELSGSKS